MTKEYEGKTEQEAINKAIEELHIEREDFDVEVLDNGKRGMFKKANVKIRVTVDGCDQSNDSNRYDEFEENNRYGEDDNCEENINYEENENYEENQEDFPTLEIDEALEQKICNFISETIRYMGVENKVFVTERKGRKIFITAESDDSSFIIGRKGKNLDAIQVFANVFAGKFDSRRKIIVDSEHYREKHNQMIIKEAFRVASMVKKTGRSRFLEPMNPYERHIVHSALNDVTGIETKSEGEGLYKRVRIINKKRR